MKTLKSNTLNLRWAFITVIALAVVWAFFTNRTPATAQFIPTRIAVLDTEKVLTNSAAGKAARVKLDIMVRDAGERAGQIANEMRNLSEIIDTQRSSLTESKLAELTQQRDAKQAELQRYRQSAEKEMKVAQEKAMGDVEKKIMPVVNAIGKEMGLAAVFRKYESGIVYAADEIDITDAAIQRMN